MSSSVHSSSSSLSGTGLSSSQYASSESSVKYLNGGNYQTTKATEVSSYGNSGLAGSSYGTSGVSGLSGASSYGISGVSGTSGVTSYGTSGVSYAGNTGSISGTGRVSVTGGI